MIGSAKFRESNRLVSSPSSRMMNRLLIAFIVILSVAFLFPFYWMIIGTFKTSTVAMQLPPEFFPASPTLQNLSRLFAATTNVRLFGETYKMSAALRWFWNSLYTAAAASLLVCLTSSMAGYSLAKKKYPLRQLIFWMFIITMALPKQVLLIPLFMMARDLNWVNTYTGLIVPVVGWPFGVFLVKQFAQTMPDELLEAARIDGSGEARTFVHIALPLLKPAVGALAIFTFMSTWNDYFWQTILLTATPMKTIQLGVESLQTVETTRDLGITMAGATVATLPMLAVFIIFQKYFTQGITLGAIKG